MPRVPSKVSELIAFCDEHAAAWAASPTTIGLKDTQVTDLKNASTAAADAVAAQLAARSAAKSATLTANTAVSALRRTIAGCIRSIVTYAEAAADPMAVFAEAQIPPTAEPTPSAPPGQPVNLTATLDDEGDITLRWKCANPPGGNIVYSINRRTSDSGAFTQIGVVGTRSFTDSTIPAGSASVQYQIRGFRGQMAGPASPVFLLQFGHGGGGGLTISMAPSTEKAPLKVAA